MSSPDGNSAGAVDQSAKLYVTRSIGPSRIESTANKSGSSIGRSSLCGHHAPSSFPAVDPLGFKRRRGVIRCPVCVESVELRPLRSVIRRSCLGRESTKSFESATTQSQTAACEISQVHIRLHAACTVGRGTLLVCGDFWAERGRI